MGKDTGIEWTNHSFNSWWGCSKVSPGCQFCYAEGVAQRFGTNIWGPPKSTSRRLFGDKHWAEPLAWDRAAAKAGRPARVFTASMADVFEDHPDVVNERARLVELIERTEHLQWLLLTKRPENIMRMLQTSLSILDGNGSTWRYPEEWLASMGDRVWIGTSVEDQQRADERIPHLLKVPAAIRFLSVEPLLGPVDLWEPRYANPDGSMTGAISTWHGAGVQWVIIGGESGPHARPMKRAWVRRIRDDCVAAGVPFFYKQTGEWEQGLGPVDDSSFAGGAKVTFGKGGFGVSIYAFSQNNTKYRLFDGDYFWRRGKKSAGRELDGETWSEFPGQRLIDNPVLTEPDKTSTISLL